MKFFHALYLSYFSQPVENRALFQHVHRWKPRKILEIGIQRATRTVNLLDLASCHQKAEDIEYYCIDPFEGRSVFDGPGLSLRKAYKLLTPFKTQLRIIPGLPEECLRQIGTGGDFQLLVLATPELDWLKSHGAILADLLASKGVAFVGQSTPDGKPFELRMFSPDELRDFGAVKRAVA